MSFTADQVFDTGDHEPVSIASTSMIEHVAIPAVNQTFDATGKTPLDPKTVKLKSYGERKLRQLQAGVRETLQMNKPKEVFCSKSSLGLFIWRVSRTPACNCLNFRSP